jgi:uncharacterized membrane protein YhaH (DUF805 family)
MIEVDAIKPKWDTNGRLSKQAYKKSQGGFSLLGLVLLLVGAIVVLNFTRGNIWLSYGVVAVVAVYAVYLQYRNAQLSIRRLHDRGLPGWLFWPVPLVGLAAIGTAALLLVKVMFQGGLFEFLGSLPGLLEPIVRIYFFNGLGFWATGLILLYNIFLWYNLGARGTPGPNAYGDAPE